MIAAAARDRGHPIPKEAIPPDLAEECVFAYVAFRELVTDRPVGFGIGSIPWTAIDAYARRYGVLDIDEFEQLVVLIRAAEIADAKYRPKEQ